MPWKIEGDYSQCPAAKPWAVLKEGDDELAGCHETREGAVSQIAALEAGEADDKGSAQKMEHKNISFEVKAFDYKKRTLEGIASAFGNVDLGMDIIHEGAFTKTLAERGNKVRFLWQHKSDEPIGRIIEIREIDAGLYIKAIISNTSRGRDSLELLNDKAIDGLSIGYDPIGRPDLTKTDNGTVRNLREVRLWEVSLVTFPMNEEATVTSLKRLVIDSEGVLVPAECAETEDNDGANDEPDQDDADEKSVKIGRAISAANAARLMIAVENAQRSLQMLEELLIVAGIVDVEQEAEAEEVMSNISTGDLDKFIADVRTFVINAPNGSSINTTAPADDKAGRDDDGAGPDKQPPTLADDRARLLFEIESFNI